MKGPQSVPSHQGWERGPLPPDTYDWGGVVPVGERLNGGFYFADFRGDHVEIYPGGSAVRVLQPHEVAWFNNGLKLPPAYEG
jgi:hypothetical protein